jgi:hypothetical protein
MGYKHPTAASAFCKCLAGKSLKIILDENPVAGPVLEYSFKSDSMLALKEDGGEEAQCAYGALSLGNMTLFSHLIPGTKKGYNVIINWKTSVVTVVEMWFIDYQGDKIDTSEHFYDYNTVLELKPFVNREVQRQYYYGYFEVPGEASPTQRDKLSLRLENTIVEWKEDRGKRRLATYTSTTFTTQVDLDTPDGGDVLTFPSDILQVSNSQYIYSFGEVEYSGRLSVEILDLFSMEKIGVTFGIDEDDEIEHVLYKGCGSFKGRYATFYSFNDKGDAYSTSTTDRYDYTIKGTRPAYRPSIMTKQLTSEALTKASKRPLIFSEERAAERVMMSEHVLDDSDYCIGKTIVFSGDDNFTVEMRFDSLTMLEYRMDCEGDWHKEPYRAMELDEDLIVLGFYKTGSNPPENLMFALDFKNGCATCISSIMGSKYDLHDPVPYYHFGVMYTEGVTPLRMFRHGFTDELLGRAYTQTYSKSMSSIHIYNAPHSYSWTIINLAEPGTPACHAGGPVWSSPCEYIKLRDDVYVMNWVEQKWSGHMDTIFRNLRTARDCGFAYGVTYDATTIYMDKLGGLSRFAGSVDLSDVYSMKNYNPYS